MFFRRLLTPAMRFGGSMAVLRAPLFVNHTHNSLHRLIIQSPKATVINLSISTDLLQDFLRAFQGLILIVRLLMRLVVLAVLYVPLFVTFPVYYFIDMKGLKENEVPKRQWWIHYFLWTLETAGPSWIKLGQWASSRKDLFPIWVCSLLSKLQNDVHPHSYAYTRLMVEESFGRPIEEAFIEFSPLPVGVGAVAQVYKAKIMLPTGEVKTVGVKVLHPNARPLVQLDLIVMKSVAKVIEFVVPESHWLSLPEEVEMFEGMMNQQLDMNHEAQNLALFQKNFTDWSHVGFPTPLFDYTSKDILVETWIDGIPLNQFLKMGPGRFDKEVATLSLTSFLKMLLLDNHLHADMHPGNMFVGFHRKGTSDFLTSEQTAHLTSTTDPAVWKEKMDDLAYYGFTPYLYLIDAGLTTSLSSRHLANLIDLFKAVTEFDGLEISSLMVSRSKTPETVINFNEFSTKMQGFMSDIRRNTLALRNIQVTEILGFVAGNVRQHHVKMDSEFANIGVAILLLEGIGKQLEPDMDLLKAAVPFLIQAIKMRVGGTVSNNESSFWTFIRQNALTFIKSLVFGTPKNL